MRTAEIPMQVDRAGAAGAHQRILPLPGEERPAERAVPLEIAVAERRQQGFGLVDVAFADQQVDVVVFALCEVAVERERQRRPLERRERDTMVCQQCRRGSEFAGQCQGAQKMVALECLEIFPGTRGNILPRQRSESPRQTGSHAMDFGQSDQIGMIDPAAQEPGDTPQVRLRLCRSAKQIELCRTCSNFRHRRISLRVIQPQSAVPEPPPAYSSQAVRCRSRR